MGLIRLPRGLNSGIAPGLPLEIDPTHPLAGDVIVCALPIKGGVLEVVTGKVYLPSSLANLVVTDRGYGLLNTDDGGKMTIPIPGGYVLGTGPGLALFGVADAGASSSNKYLCEITPANDTGLGLYLAANEALAARIKGATDGTTTSTQTGITGVHAYAVNWDVGTGYVTSYLDGAAPAQSQEQCVTPVSGALTQLFVASSRTNLEWESWVNIVIAFRRPLSPREHALLAKAPYGMLKPVNDAVWAATSAGGAAAALEGAAAAQASASGALTTQIPLTAAAAVVATASGALSTAIPLAGAAASVSVAEGVLTTQITLSGAALAQAAATGSLTTQISLSGAAIAQALASAGLTTSPQGLAGDATAQASASGALLTAIPLAGAATAYATGAGNLSTIITLAGAAASVSSATGDLLVESTLSGAALAQALAAGSLTTQIKLSGSALAQAAASGSLGVGSGIPATLHHLVDAAHGTWEVTADYGPWEVAA